MSLTAQPELAGKIVACPGCSAKFQVPDTTEQQPGGEFGTSFEYGSTKPVRGGWVESDPTNPNVWLALGIGTGIALLIYLVALPFRGTYFYDILYLRGWVNFAETFFFGWGIGILVLKSRKLRHQQNALLLDVLPMRFGREINRDNVADFVESLYRLPFHLRDSLMVNRMRKALELFESKQSSGEVGNMMGNQSGIDSIRIAGSYALLKFFVWVIPILGFVGTVLGLSIAIGYFQGVMGNAKDIDVLLNSMSGVTGGLSTAFDTTLLGLIYAILLSFPMSTMQKLEDDSLNAIDAYCNEKLLPRLNERGSLLGGDDAGALGPALEALAREITGAQAQFLTDLNTTSGLVREQVEGLERRANIQAQFAQQQFAETLAAMQQTTSRAIEQQLSEVKIHVAALAESLGSLNRVLGAVGEKQIAIEVKPRGFFSRLLRR